MMDAQIEFYTWADRIAGEMQKRKVKKQVVHGMWTPSGYFHIGNARTELLIPGLVFQALEDAGTHAKFNFFVDDADDLDAVPAGLNLNAEDFKEHLGKPIYEAPSPDYSHETWADYFTAEIKDVMHEYGLRPKWHSSYENYHKGLYDDSITTALNSARKIRDIWVKITRSDKPENWLPVIVKCENCGRSGTTNATGWDGKHLSYSCTQDREYAKGCRHEGRVIPKKGNVKLPWRLHWPATWNIFKTTFESAGKDHFAASGSVDTGKVFSEEIFKYAPPLLVGGEFVQIKGKKISGSKGNAISLKQWLEFAEPELLRFMMISYQPQTVIEFDLESNKLFLLADRYDEAESVYFREKSLNEKRDSQLKREYMLSQTKKPAKMPQISYSIASMISQVYAGRSTEEIINLLESMGAIKNPGKKDTERIARRLQLAKTWVEKYAPEEMRINVRETASKEFVSSLNENEKKALAQLASELDAYKKEGELQSRIYEIARENNVEPKRLFGICYQLLIGRDSGPRLGPFIITIGKDKVKGLFGRAIN
ncbi:MAG: lysine--tRNA ligase [Candidatus Aenigmarchaeota archaeon]|nr:lysine--tRNA ligase [Candidatus Aenigmarchaeota archaeon]